MKLNLFLSVANICIFISTVVAVTFASAENKLFKRLTEDYDKFSRPVNSSTTSVDVKLKISLSQIYDVCPKLNEMTSKLYLHMQWQERFSWDATTENVNKLIVPISEIWTPNIRILNRKDKKQYLGNELATILPSGEVQHTLMEIPTTSCTFDATYFPFDQQICIFKFASEAYNGDEVQLSLIDASWVDLSSYYMSFEWQILEVPIYINVMNGNSKETDLTAYITIRRHQFKQKLEIILPLFLVAFLSILTLVISTFSREKLTLNGIFMMGTFAFFVYCNHSFNIQYRYAMPLLVKLFIQLMALHLTTFILNIFLVNWSHRDGHFPRILQILLLEKIGKFTLFGYRPLNLNPKKYEIQNGESNCDMEIYTKERNCGMWKNSGEVLGILCFVLALGLLGLIYFCFDAPHLNEVVEESQILALYAI